MPLATLPGREAVKRHVELARQRAEDLVIGDHGQHLRVQLAESVPHQNVREAMVLLRGQHDHALGGELGQADPPVGRQRGPELGDQGVAFDSTVELGAHEEPARRPIDELMVADDVESAAGERAGDRVDQARAIGTFDEQNRWLHDELLQPDRPRALMP